MRGTWALVAVVAFTMTMGEAVAQERRSSDDTKKVKKVKKRKKTSKTKKVKKSRTSRGDKSSAHAATKSDVVAVSYVKFTVKTYPRGARINVDGESVGKAPVSVRVPRGRRVISAKLKGYADARTTVQVDDGLGYMVFSLARASGGSRVADKPPKVQPKAKRKGFGTSKLKHSEAIRKARATLKRSDYDAALRYAEAALSRKPADQEARMIATIAACGNGDSKVAKRHLPQDRSSYREISLKRCRRLGIELD